jgi:hypothetical protein
MKLKDESLILEWIDGPPPTRHGTKDQRQVGRSLRLALALMERPGQWAIVDLPSRSMGGFKVWGSQNRIKVEAVLRDGNVYARVVGPMEELEDE